MDSGGQRELWEYPHQRVPPTATEDALLTGDAAADTAPPAFAATVLPAPEAVVAARALAVFDPDAPPIDFLRLKVAFRRLFPSGHPVRSVVEAEPDVVPRREGLAKLEMIVRLVWALRRNRA